MPSERFTATCSSFELMNRSYFDETDRRTKQHTFVICSRDGGYCVPGKFPTQCPDRQGQVIDLVVVRSGQLFNELGRVTILTGRHG